MLDKFNRAFPQRDQCFQTLTVQQFCVYDHAELKRCFVQNDPDGVVHFTVNNPTEKAIHLLAVDGCLLSSADPSRCDCAIFDESTLCLVEIKTVSKKQRRNKRLDAENQLKASALFFQTQLSLTEEFIEAYVCLLDSNTFGPCVRSNSASQILQFANLGIDLHYTNKKHFL